MLATLALATSLVTVSPLKTKNVILVMTDGLRWEEVFRGLDTTINNKAKGKVENPEELAAKYGGRPEVSRERLMPFLWTTIARQGQIFGNPLREARSRVTNGLNFSYPGYSETLCGFVDPGISSNAKRPNPNVTVFEWLSRQTEFRSKVAAFGAWDVFPSIFNAERCGFPVNAGYEPFTKIPETPVLTVLNAMKREVPHRWEGEPYDALTFYTALEYLKVEKPRLLFISLGETDEWAHEREYKRYLDSANVVDGFVSTLWKTVQSIPHYKGKTTLIFLPDHGRGATPDNWTSHGQAIAESEFTWMAFMGPDTPALGERSGRPMVEQRQIAATLARLLGVDYQAAQPKAGPPIADVFPQ
jgi:hypothetical protein